MSLDGTILYWIHDTLSCSLLDTLMPKLTLLGNGGAIWLLAAGGTIGQVALQCGFASDASFIRVFKQYKGVTPGRFREENA